jgi:hypothetical protein
MGSIDGCHEQGSQHRRLLVGVAAGILLIGGIVCLGYIALRHQTLQELQDYDASLSPAARRFAECSRDPDVCDMLTLRIENTNWVDLAFEAQYLLEENGKLGLNRLAGRIDALLQQRRDASEREHQQTRLDVRLLKLFEAWDNFVGRAYPGMESDELFLGTEDRKKQFISRYLESRDKVLVQGN